MIVQTRYDNRKWSGGWTMKNNGLLFVREMIRHPRTTGAVWPSSSALSQQMAKRIPADAKVIVEIGPGTGAMTPFFLDAAPDAQFVLVEINSEFVKTLRKRFDNMPNVRIVQASATLLPAILCEHGLGQADAVMSGLPFTSLPIDESKRVLQAVVDSLRPGGRFVTFQYTKVMKRLFDAYMRSVTWSPVLKNFPPAFVVLLEQTNEAT